MTHGKLVKKEIVCLKMRAFSMFKRVWAAFIGWQKKDKVSLPVCFPMEWPLFVGQCFQKRSLSGIPNKKKIKHFKFYRRQRFMLIQLLREMSDLTWFHSNLLWMSDFRFFGKISDLLSGSSFLFLNTQPITTLS